MNKFILATPFLATGMIPLLWFGVVLLWGGWLYMWPIGLFAIQIMSLWMLFKMIWSNEVKWHDARTWTWTVSAWTIYHASMVVHILNQKNQGGTVHIAKWVQSGTYAAAIGSLILAILGWIKRKKLNQPCDPQP